MAIVTRWFSTTGNGDQTGSSWENRAPLLSAGDWSTILTSTHNFTADSCVAYVGPGNYALSTSLQTSEFTNAPTAENPLIFRACDSSGNPLAIPDPDWISPMPAWDDSALPVIATTTNMVTSSLANTFWRLIKFTASGSLGNMITNGTLSWCVVVNSTSSTSTGCSSAVGLTNCVMKCIGANYASIVVMTAGAIVLSNVRIEGTGTGGTGNRRGFEQTSNNNAVIEGMTVVNCGGDGVIFSGSITGAFFRLRRCTIANNGGTGIKGCATASQTAQHSVEGCMITGNGVAGIDGQSAARMFVTGTRLRDNNSQNFINLGNYPTGVNNWEADSDDATEYVSAGANGDFRIKTTATDLWGWGFGAGDQ